jgi:molybdopterin converting factor small subunit
MQIEFKLFANLMEYLPEGAGKHAVSLEVAESTTPHQLIDRYHVPRKDAHLVLINGVYMDESARDLPMHPGDTLAIWPPVAGG